MEIHDIIFNDFDDFTDLTGIPIIRPYSEFDKINKIPNFRIRTYGGGSSPRVTETSSYHLSDRRLPCLNDI